MKNLLPSFCRSLLGLIHFRLELSAFGHNFSIRLASDLGLRIIFFFTLAILLIQLYLLVRNTAGNTLVFVYQPRDLICNENRNTVKDGGCWG